LAAAQEQHVTEALLVNEPDHVRFGRVPTVQYTLTRVSDYATANFHYASLTCLCLSKLVTRTLVTFFLLVLFIIYATLVTLHNAAFGKQATQSFDAICSSANVNDPSKASYTSSTRCCSADLNVC